MYRRAGVVMRQNYSDITSRIAEAPAWFDEAAVPRYCAFTPAAVANVYAVEVVLAEIACQSCGKVFRVSFSGMGAPDRLSDLIRSRELEYGDPPAAYCSDAGQTISSISLRVLEYWFRSGLDWKRDPDLEVDIRPAWSDGCDV